MPGGHGGESARLFRDRSPLAGQRVAAGLYASVCRGKADEAVGADVTRTTVPDAVFRDKDDARLGRFSVDIIAEAESRFAVGLYFHDEAKEWFRRRRAVAGRDSRVSGRDCL